MLRKRRNREEEKGEVGICEGGEEIGRRRRSMKKEEEK